MARLANGTASFNQVGKLLTVTNSSGAILEWNRFGIPAGEAVRFIQSSASSSVLNRVLAGGGLSAIYGSLSSNGKVWLVNPAGILVGPGGTVDTAGFVASTLAVRDADFLAGRLTFSGAGGDVTNQGSITTPAGGSVYLIGANVGNEGIINSPRGEVILAAGQTVNLVDTATPGIKVEITGAAGNTTNLGTIAAEAGRIGMAGVVVRNSGLLNASSAVAQGGKVFLRASRDAYVDGNGRIVATGTRGGRVEVLGDTVTLTDRARIDASGERGGGRIMVGGDYQGRNPAVRNAQRTYFGPNSRLVADAKKVGDGGTVIVWADDTTRAYGDISARGGAEGGDGGFVEVSGKQTLDFTGFADRRAPRGKAGMLLLDPAEITIDSAYWTTIDSALSGGPVTIDTSGGGGIEVVPGIYTSLNSGNLTLRSRGSSAYGAESGHIKFNNAKMTIGGSFSAYAGWDGASNVTSGYGDIVMDATSTLWVSNVGSNVTFKAGRNIFASLVKAPTGTIDVFTRGRIVDNNGTFTDNFVADTVYLYSTGMSSLDGIAISADVNAFYIEAEVSGGNFGGIDIRQTNAGMEPSYVRLADFSTTPGYGNVRYQTAGNANLDSNIYDFSAAKGSISFTANGAVAAGSDIGNWVTGGTLSVSAGSSMNVVGAISSNAKQLSLAAGGDLMIYNGVTSTGGDLLLSAGGLLGIDAPLAATDGAGALYDIAMSGNTVHFRGGGIDPFSAANVSVIGQQVMIENVVGAQFNVDIAAGGNISIGAGGYVDAGNNASLTTIFGDIVLEDGAQVLATNHVYLDLFGGASRVVLNGKPDNPNPSTILAAYAGGPGRVNIAFQNRASGGIIIDGVETDTTEVGHSGFFVNGEPAVLGLGLNLFYGLAIYTYESPAVTALVQAFGDGSAACHFRGTCSGVYTPDAYAAVTTEQSFTLFGGQTTGGGENQFGGTQGSTQQEPQLQFRRTGTRKVGRCT
ncbi:two-partner secretion domain-containing protein [Sulfurisoma sediminicola]|uniref:two-partner secretion domain-containing protein n=1 Tax=Sulfurisoma sediminicola TaxID=1381557 RepID=UPI00140529C4|nr:filamentous hemagglutinin N-terminal domain-containing protein [Sulfurisoma sediminicola]